LLLFLLLTSLLLLLLMLPLLWLPLTTPLLQARHHLTATAQAVERHSASHAQDDVSTTRVRSATASGRVGGALSVEIDYIYRAMPPSSSSVSLEALAQVQRSSPRPTARLTDRSLSYLLSC